MINSSRVDVNMPKPVNCCVPGCTNNFRNNPALKYYRIPKEMWLRRQYKILIRNTTLKLNSDNTRICAHHFEGGNKRSRHDLPSIFPWSKAVSNRRVLKRLPVEDVIKVPTKSGRKPSARLSSTDDIAGNSLDRNGPPGSE